MPTSEPDDAPAQLPPELLLQLFSLYLPPATILTRCARVCRTWHALSLDPALWLQKLSQLDTVPAVDAHHASKVLALLAGKNGRVEYASTRLPRLRVHIPKEDAYGAALDFSKECRGLSLKLLRPLDIPDPRYAHRTLSLVSSLLPLLVTRLGLRPLAASTVDHPTQDIWSTIDASRTTFWSSTGTASSLLESPKDTAEHLIYSLELPCLVTRVLITPFQATFQRGSPTYAPVSVRIGLTAEAPSGDANLELVYLSDPILIPCRAVPFEIRIPDLFFPANGLVVFMQGKVTAQPTDGLFYTCVECLTRILRLTSLAVSWEK